MLSRAACVALLVFATPVLAQPGPDGPLYELTAEQSDLRIEAPEFGEAHATYRRQRIAGEAGLRDLVVLRLPGEAVLVAYDSVDPNARGSMARFDGPQDAVQAFRWFLPAARTFAWGQASEVATATRSYPVQRFRFTFGDNAAAAGSGDCAAFLRTYDPRPGRAIAAKRLSGIHCRTSGVLDDARLKALLDGIRTRQ